MDGAGREILRKQITDKQLTIVSLDLTTSHPVFISVVSDEFTRSMLKAANGMMLDILAEVARKDYEDRRRRPRRGSRKQNREDTAGIPDG